MGERQTEDLKVPGSIPGGGIFLKNFVRTKLTSSTVKYVTLSHTRALVAQMVERKTLNLVVVGAIPTEGVFLFTNAKVSPPTVASSSA